MASRGNSRVSIGSVERVLIIGVLWVEIVLNTCNGLVSIFAPALSIAPMMNPAIAYNTDVGVEPVRWFGAMNVFVGWLLYRSLRTPVHLPLLLEALCIGDWIYMASLVPFAIKFGSLPGIVFPFLLTIIMFIARLRLLLGEDWERVARRND